jgi:hypothetical protein
MDMIAGILVDLGSILDLENGELMCDWLRIKEIKCRMLAVR